MTEKQKTDLPIFVYTYLLLGCYNTAFRESRVPLGKFNNDSWWFFTAGDFKIIANYLDIEIIIGNFNKLIDKEPSKLEVTPAAAKQIVVDNGPEAKRERAAEAAKARIAGAEEAARIAGAEEAAKAAEAKIES